MSNKGMKITEVPPGVVLALRIGDHCMLVNGQAQIVAEMWLGSPLVERASRHGNRWVGAQPMQ